MTTTYHVTRDTADARANDETRAMAHVSIHSGDDLADARYHLGQYMLAEAASLVKDRDITRSSDLWAFQRATALAAAAEGAVTDDVLTGQCPVRITVEGLRFTITAVERKRAKPADPAKFLTGADILDIASR